MHGARAEAGAGAGAGELGNIEVPKFESAKGACTYIMKNNVTHIRHFQSTTILGVKRWEKSTIRVINGLVLKYVVFFCGYHDFS